MLLGDNRLPISGAQLAVTETDRCITVHGIELVYAVFAFDSRQRGNYITYSQH